MRRGDPVRESTCRLRTPVRRGEAGAGPNPAQILRSPQPSKGVIMTTEVRSADGAESPHLRRELRLWEAVGISLALMAPSMAANINPQGTAGSIGRAVPLAFALATVGVLLIAWTFVRLTQRFNHAGSV